MSKPAEDRPGVEELLSTTVAPFADTIDRDPNRTIEPPASAPDTGRRPEDMLSRLGARIDSDLGGRLRLGETLGKGGMGHVHLGVQVALDRGVAVKTLLPEHRDERSVLRLLQEAWTTGALEHPNVVPVYDIAFDEDRRPMVVLKRIEGVSWAELMDDPDGVRERFRARDLLLWNLDILTQVCNAAAFAHSKGIIHRDLKPDNVMIGAFGEVYLLDWGIAVSLEDDGSGRLPLAAGADDLAGTPSYMAPEMLGGGGALLSERTDVYLLGAILFEILDGGPPHTGENIRQIIRSVVQSSPALPAAAPAELARICRKALRYDQAERFASAEDLQHAVQDYVQHRGSAQLADEAGRRLARLEQLLERRPERADAGASSPAAAAGGAARRAEIYRLFSECRFGFQQALKEWPENAAALAGLRGAVELMASYEVAAGDPRAAATLLADHDDPPAALRRRIEAAQESLAQGQRKMEELAAVGRDMDLDVGRRTRVFLALLLGGFWTVAPVFCIFFIQDTPYESFQVSFAHTFAILLVAAVLAIWARDSLTKTVINRRVVATVGFLFVSQALMLLIYYIVGVDVVQGIILIIFLWFVVATMAAIAIDWRLFPAAIGFLAASFLAVIWPEYRYHVIAAVNLVFTINIAVIWGHGREDEATRGG